MGSVRSSWICAVGVCFSLAAGSAVADTSDAFLEGYVSALVEKEFPVEARRVEVRDGVVEVTVIGLAPGDADRIRREVESLDGVREVRVLEDEPAPTPAESAPGADEPAARPSGGTELFPAQRLFPAPIADPRWPRFDVGYQGYFDDVELGNVAAVSFGENFPLVSGAAPFAGRWEVGIQGGVFSVFDLDSYSFDLINSDFIGGVTTAYRRGRFATTLRFFHQSSHLGDEYLLRSPIDRVNLSFEELALLVGYDFFGMLRLAAGGGYIVHREPADLEPGSLQVCADFESPRPFAGGHLRPIAGVDLQFREESDWELDRSVVAGLQVESTRMGRIKMRMLLEYYGGRSPNGQFYVREVEYLGFAVRVAY